MRRRCGNRFHQDVDAITENNPFYTGTDRKRFTNRIRENGLSPGRDGCTPGEELTHDKHIRP